MRMQMLRLLISVSITLKPEKKSFYTRHT